MFPRGPRFEPFKVPDAPAPNAYNPRPAPTKTPAKLQQSLNERYNALQKKLEDLERVHQEGKKAHCTELERLKSDLSCCRKTISEQTERIDKQKRQNESLDFRIQELRKAAHADQTEIKDLRAKLKAVEHEKATLSTKHAEVVETKKVVQTFESKHKDELRERDRRITDLERALGSENKQRATLEAKLHDLKSKGDADVQAIRNGAQQTETQLTNVQQELSAVSEELVTSQKSLARERECFLVQLAHHNSALSKAAKQYGQLASNTVFLSDHRKLERLHTAAELNIRRLERKLGDTEAQVVELAHLVRQVNDRSDILKEQLAEATYQITVYEGMLNDSTPLPTDASADPHLQLEQIMQETNHHHQELQIAEDRLQELTSTCYTVRSQQLLLAYTCLDKELTQVSNLAKQRSQDLASTLASHEAIAATLESMKKDRSNLSDETRDLKANQAALQQNCASLEDQVATLEEQQRQYTLAQEAAVKKEKDAVQRLSNTLQKSRVAEDALRTEIDRILTELADAERYQEAYNSLSEEVGALIARNKLAEEEAEHLSKFNAEILGHNNPAQRISYVDRIRRELAEAKHKIIMLTRDQETVVALNADLQHELDMYKSVITTDKPRTHVTRVQRMPLSNVTRNINGSTSATPPVAQVKVAAGKSTIINLGGIPGDMTLDEIM